MSEVISVAVGFALGVGSLCLWCIRLETIRWLAQLIRPR